MATIVRGAEMNSIEFHFEKNGSIWRTQCQIAVWGISTKDVPWQPELTPAEAGALMPPAFLQALGVGACNDFLKAFVSEAKKVLSSLQ
jgi:hypothetical protein